jgi:choline-sulfatase
MLSIMQAGTCQTSNQLDFDEEVAFLAVRKVYEFARDDDERPFCLFVSFSHPHDPFAITQEYWDRYDPGDVDGPSMPALPAEELDPHSQRLYHVCDLGRYRQTETRVRKARHAYYAAISYVDDKVGQLLRALEATGLAENTVVLFTSDHGEMLGERGLWYKMSFFEWSARVPLVVHAPRRFAPHRVARNVSLVDILPTLLQLANTEAQDLKRVDRKVGHSLLPLLEGSDDRGNDTAVSEILCEGALAPCFMIRRGRYKYVYSEPDPDQLYDLESDPGERENLAQHQAYDSLRCRFLDEVMARWDPEGIYEEVIASQRRRRLVFRSLSRGRQAPWNFQPYQDASRQYVRSDTALDDVESRARFPKPDRMSIHGAHN